MTSKLFNETRQDVIFEEFLLCDLAERGEIDGALDGLGDPITWIKAEGIAAWRTLFGKA